MPKYRKKPVVIEAIQLTEKLFWEMEGDSKQLIFGKFHFSGSCHPINKKIGTVYVSIITLEGAMRADLNDWIIKGIQGEFYPCKPDIFEKTYELVTD